MDDLLDPKTRTFIRVAEVWVPEKGRLVLERGTYAGLEDFGTVSERTDFAKGAGLPGRAWDEARPVVLGRLDGSDFRRAEAAAKANLTAAVAIPVFAGAELKAVLVVLFAEANHSGAIEVWEDSDGALALSDGYYGSAEEFEAVSRGTRFGHGQGLPGGVWASGTPILMRDLGASYGFLRAESAGRAGLKTGLGLPIPTPGDKTYVLTLLSAPGTPIAQRFEIWDARPERVGPERKALRIDGLCAREGPLAPKENPPLDAVAVTAWQGPVGRVLGSGLPLVQTGSAGLPAGYTQMIALPIHRETGLAYVVAWYL
ncbi:GAF domain-containing protein [Salipiger sp. H15]|uniref:GAF domain-containing protein n=1 Tax=Alloyangia sp. H15 TaxID=3029062 RepID=A0AAU8ALE1_9RHOB